MDSLRTSLSALRRGLERQETQKARLETRIRELEAESRSQEDQFAALETEKQTMLERRADVQKRLEAARRKAEGIDARIRPAEQSRLSAERAV